ncbi:MAG: nucleotidyltransferase [Peptococcaceae bacterium]|nr:nucleotidyltransferase [Peptococcaceae bacterium]
MQVTGIVAEYNPFHNGHQYHIAETRALQQPDGIIAVMSGNFTQRGEAAVFDKWTRAEMALRSGADLVLELPAAFAVRSAGYFAQGAVQTLAATGVVSHLSCGVESQRATELSELAAFLAEESADYQAALQQHLQAGVSFPAARQKALTQLQIAGADQLEQPNNILALHYLQTIQQYHLDITPVLISRRGSYLNDTLPSDGQSFASASAVRKLLHEENSLWQEQVPDAVRQIIHQQLQQGYLPMHNDHFTQVIFALLRRSTPEQLADIIEMNEGLENRIYTAAHQVDTLDDLRGAIKSKRYTYTRIQRTLIHLLLNMTQQMHWADPHYIRVLGFNGTGQKILKEMKKTAQLPVIIRTARQRSQLNKDAQQMLSLDCRATNLYTMGYALPSLRKTSLDLLRMPVQV